jgi:hypothetical protein
MQEAKVEVTRATAPVLGCFVAALLSLLLWAGIVWLACWLMGVIR